MSGPSEGGNKPSSLLKQYENDEIFSMLGRRCVTLATSVAQLYIAPPENRRAWKKKVTGVICFVKDCRKRSYFLRMYSLVTKSLEWEQELYNQFKYTPARPYFHAFVADSYNAGLNFANAEEAQNFLNVIEEKLKEKEQRRLEFKKEIASRHGKQPPPPPAVGGNVDIGKGTSLQASGKNNFSNMSHSPSQTSLAQANRFIGHIGWDPQAGFDVDRLDDKWQELFSLVGVTAEQMQGKELMDFIYDFVEKRGGIDNVIREIEKEKATEPQERKRREVLESPWKWLTEKPWEWLKEMWKRKGEEVPSEIHARGPVAVKAFNNALKDGEASVNRIPIILVGQERTGKTSLKRSLKGDLFDKFEESTDGIRVDPAYFKLSKEIWKTGEKIEDAGPGSSPSFENLAAKLILERLRENLSLQDAPEEQNRNATNFATEKNNTDTGSSSSSQPNGNDYSRRHMPEIPEEVHVEPNKLLQRERDVCDIDDIYAMLWDFAGRSVYYDTHSIFLIENAIYLLVANLSQNPEEKATQPVKEGLYRNIVDSHSNRTNLDYLDFWMSSIFSLVSSEFSCPEAATNGHENLPGRLPPVFLVCTHADKPLCSTNARDQALEIYGFLRSKTYREHLFKDVFAVDNTKSGGDHECPEVVRLREKVLAVAKELPLMKTKIPLRWLKYESLLHIRMEHDKWIPLNEARRIAFDECIIHNEAEFSTLLNFLHDQRIVVHFSGSPELERMVILDPQWLVDVLKKIITVKRYEHSGKQVESMWLKLEDTGVLDERLIDHAWRDLFDNQESRDSLIAILERLSILCSWPSADSYKQYLVPSLLMSPPTEYVLKLLDSVKMPPLFITFASGRVPPGLFSRLILLFLQWCKEEWKSEVSPQLFHNFAMFYILPGQGVSLIFRCHSSSIEIVVYRGDIDNETGAKSSYENYDQTLGRAIHWKLRLVLECMRKEFHWLKNVKYDMCVCCPVCSQAGYIKFRSHDVYECECLHFLSESDLRQRQYCDRPGRSLPGDCRIQLNQFECWFSFEDVEKSAGISTNRQPQAFNAPGPESSLDEEGMFPLEGTTRKELALPENVKSSIQSISFRSTSDVKDIVIQFQETLQLEPASLTSPEPETKSMIRGLALRAKSEKRDDLVRHLRKITPAGTTGPLLNEDLPIGCMPYKQYKDLTFSLSGGDEWKLLAERLGFSQIEIRFLDKRAMNPSDVVLGAVGKHRHLSVGEIYETLVDCELPAVADLM